MAKILTGPLAAGLSGKLGPVVFHQTRFGQVVQSKAKPRTYTTPAAMETKATFSKAARMWGTMPDFWKSTYAAFGASLGRSGQGMVISSLMTLVRTGDAGPMPTTGTQKPPTFGTPFYAGGRWRIPFTDPNGPDIQWTANAWRFAPDGTVAISAGGVPIGANVVFAPTDAAPLSYVWTTKLNLDVALGFPWDGNSCAPVGIAIP